MSTVARTLNEKKKQRLVIPLPPLQKIDFYLCLSNYFQFIVYLSISSPTRNVCDKKDLATSALSITELSIQQGFKSFMKITWLFFVVPALSHWCSVANISIMRGTARLAGSVSRKARRYLAIKSTTDSQCSYRAQYITSASRNGYNLLPRFSS